MVALGRPLARIIHQDARTKRLKKVHTEFTEAITVAIIEPLQHRVHQVIIPDVSVFSGVAPP